MQMSCNWWGFTWLAPGAFEWGTKEDDITEILLKVALNTITTQTRNYYFELLNCFKACQRMQHGEKHGYVVLLFHVKL